MSEMRQGSHTPPGWPAEVRPPGAPDWELSAVRWLIGLCPPAYRSHPLLARHPAVLARFTQHHIDGAVRAARRGYGTARRELGHRLTGKALEELLGVYAAEGKALAELARSVDLVRQALAGARWSPRL